MSLVGKRKSRDTDVAAVAVVVVVIVAVVFVCFSTDANKNAVGFCTVNFVENFRDGWGAGRGFHFNSRNPKQVHDYLALLEGQTLSRLLSPLFWKCGRLKQNSPEGNC